MAVKPEILIRPKLGSGPTPHSSGAPGAASSNASDGKTYVWLDGKRYEAIYRNNGRECPLDAAGLQQLVKDRLEPLANAAKLKTKDARKLKFNWTDNTLQDIFYATSAEPTKMKKISEKTIKIVNEADLSKPVSEGLRALRMRSIPAPHSSSRPVGDPDWTIPTVTDGNCAADALRIALEKAGTPVTADELRQQAAQDMRANAAHLAKNDAAFCRQVANACIQAHAEDPSRCNFPIPATSYDAVDGAIASLSEENRRILIENYANYIEQNGVYLDQPFFEIRARRMTRNIVVVNPQGKLDSIYPINRQFPDDPLFVYHDGRRHYKGVNPTPAIRALVNDANAAQNEQEAVDQFLAINDPNQIPAAYEALHRSHPHAALAIGFAVSQKVDTLNATPEKGSTWIRSNPAILQNYAIAREDILRILSRTHIENDRLFYGNAQISAEEALARDAKKLFFYYCLTSRTNQETLRALEWLKGHNLHAALAIERLLQDPDKRNFSEDDVNNLMAESYVNPETGELASNGVSLHRQPEAVPST